jgi:hypothetical protein
MTQRFQISTEWESLGEGSQEERSCFAALGIRANGIWLTEGRDALANRLRHAPFLSAYSLAEWFAWNWWRLRWEPRSSSVDWDLVHGMANVGDGYIWPNITLFSDGQRTALISKAGQDRVQSPFRYIVDAAVILPSSEFESEIDAFVAQVLERLDASGVRHSNLNTLWKELSRERADRSISRVRKVEALLGLQPDELDDATREAFFVREAEFGEGAIDELAADQGNHRNRVLLRPDVLAAEAKHAGYRTRPNDAVKIHSEPEFRQGWGTMPAWQVGARLAKTLRAQERLGDDAVMTDKALAQFISIDPAALDGTTTTVSGVSCLFAERNGEGRVMLRSKWNTGRRFELARLLGDCLVETGGTLHPATRTDTYRQKMQRAFAAELLSPFGAVINHLQGDYSAEAQADVANHFKVSELTIRTQLVNHRILDRDDLDNDAETWQFAA